MLRNIFFCFIFSLIFNCIYCFNSFSQTSDRKGLVIDNGDESFLSMNSDLNDEELYFEKEKTEYIGWIEKKENDDVIDVDNTSVDIIYPSEFGIYLVSDGLPKNTRHLSEGYWIGSLPGVSDIESMSSHGIKIILTVTSVKKSWNVVKDKIKELGIEHLYIPVGSKFPKDDYFYETLLKYNPNEIFIHCDHGGDRSGSFIAYMLVRRNKWSLQRALLSMVNPNKIDVNGLLSVLSSRGYSVTKEDMFFTGIYSGAKNGGFGGLKARNEDYRRLISTMIDNVENYITKNE